MKIVHAAVQLSWLVGLKKCLTPTLRFGILSPECNGIVFCLLEEELNTLSVDKSENC